MENNFPPPPIWSLKSFKKNLKKILPQKAIEKDDKEW